MFVVTNCNYQWNGGTVEDGATIMLGNKAAIFARNMALDGSLIIYDQSETSYESGGRLFNNQLGTIGYIESDVDGEIEIESAGVGIVNSANIIWENDENDKPMRYNGLKITPNNVAMYSDVPTKKHKLYITITPSENTITIAAPTIELKGEVVYSDWK